MGLDNFETRTRGTVTRKPKFFKHLHTIVIICFVFYLVLSCLELSYLILSGLSDLILSHLISSYLTLITLSCLVLSYRISSDSGHPEEPPHTEAPKWACFQRNFKKKMHFSRRLAGQPEGPPHTKERKWTDFKRNLKGNEPFWSGRPASRKDPPTRKSENEQILKGI